MGQQVYNVNGTYSFPTVGGVSTYTVECWGPGGNGTAGSIGVSGAGGGGGAYAKSTLTLAPGSYQVVVGAGGTSNKTIFNLTAVVADFGVTAVGQTGGAGGQAANCTGTVTQNGGTGGLQLGQDRLLLGARRAGP